MNTVLVTFSTAASLFFALKTRLIRVTDKFMDTVKAVTGGYFVAIMLTFLGSMVGLRLPGLFSGGASCRCGQRVECCELAALVRLAGWTGVVGAQHKLPPCVPASNTHLHYAVHTQHAGPIAIGISLVGAGLAAANLLLDFQWIEDAADARAPAALEWYGAQSLLLTLVWLYSEVLRLLWMLAGNRGDE
jgi:uncharacterized YccA/Bax inhibitor family protein